MPKLIRFTVHDGKAVLINPEHVVAVTQQRTSEHGGRDLTRVVCLGQGIFDVVGSIDEVSGKIEGSAS